MSTPKKMIRIIIGLREEEIKFLDRKINKKKETPSSRAAIIRMLIRSLMENPDLVSGI